MTKKVERLKLSRETVRCLVDGSGRIAFATADTDYTCFVEACPSISYCVTCRTRGKDCWP
ncbi:MAG TPA: hypothetical protein VFQ76_06055 [Longimicrobiaceae bacterium]|nr:hypothetical protein [Longimicrobiaceae bacterium]